MEIVTIVFVFLFGICIGSFLNVCIYRMPREESIVAPRSHCPGCKTMIRWFDNIPLLSYLLLSGKCRQCKTRISIRYFLVELFVGMMWVFLWQRYDETPFFVAAVICFTILLAVSITDLETGYIPDKLSLPGALAGLILSTAFPVLQDETRWYMGLLQSFLGFLAGGGILFATGYLGSIIFKKEAMGGGDIKLLAMIGAFVGWQGAIFVFMFAPVVSIPIALFERFVRKHETIPFGPYIALVGAWFFLYGNDFLKSYFYFD